MKNTSRKSILFCCLAAFIIGCAPSNSQEPQKAVAQDFNVYWYAGEAEISSYKLEQARYGEIHSGEAVLVFVTEPFSKSKQVKLDNWRDESEDNVSVLKLNMMKKFLTGIYPYSMMMSTFSPVSIDKYPNPFKITTSSQEWCGQSWMQLNLTEVDYQLQGFSYFESEGDVNQSIAMVLLEDELWSRIRINPETLPTGEVDLLPGTFYLRLKHRKNVPQKANLKLINVPSSEFSDEPHKMYEIAYENRTLTIYFDAEFPHTIFGWEETYMSGFGSPERLTTKAKRINTIKSAYWGENKNEDRKIRKELGLSTE